MEAGEFADWLSGIGRLSDEQIALALTELGAFAGRSDDVGLWPSPKARPEGESSTEEGEWRKATAGQPHIDPGGRRRPCRIACIPDTVSGKSADFALIALAVDT